MSEIIEEWRPFDTGTIVIDGYEVSSLGRVKKTKTGEMLKLARADGGSVSPHYAVDGTEKTYWRPEVLIRSIFGVRKQEPIEKVQAATWDSEIIEDAPAFGPKRRPRKTSVASQDKTPIVRHPSKSPIAVPETSLLQPEIVEARSAEVELAQMLYKPYKHEKQSESEPASMQTPQDRMAQRASTNRTQMVHGVDRVLKLYKTSAFKRGYAWELTDEEAIRLMVSSCQYCGCEPGTHNQNGLNGIDRIINADGYVDGNVVACCGKCNMMKGQRAPDEFIGHVFSIAEHQREAMGKAES